MAAENVGKPIGCDFYGMETKKFRVSDAEFILAKLVSAQIYKIALFSTFLSLLHK